MSDTTTPPAIGEEFYKQLAKPFGVQPNALHEEHNLPGVLMPVLAIPCEVSLIHPCREADPEVASFMVSYTLCDCDPDEDDFVGVAAWCTPCIEYVLAKESAQCRCGLVFAPAHEMFDDIVEIR